MRPVDLSLARCIDCGYQVRDLPAPRCPECGRAFDPADATTVNFPRRTWSIKRWFNARLHSSTGWLVGLPLAFLCWLFSEPGPYYMGIVLVGIVGLLVGGLLLAWPEPMERNGKFRRSTLLALVVGMCGSIWFFELPMRVRFAISLPAMNRTLREAKGFSVTRPYPVNRYVGLYEIGQVQPPHYSSSVWRFYQPNSLEVGFGYSDQPVHYAGVNAGAGGHLFGGWYWFSDD